MRALLIFVDGVGLGADEAASNPLAATMLPTLTALLGGQRPVAAPGSTVRPPLYALDAQLGVPGLPQSGTGQVTLLTGVNAAARLGQHLGPYPGPQLRPLLAERSLWARLVAAGRLVAYANAFPDRYLERTRRGTARMGAIARSAWLTGVPLRGPAELVRGEAVSAFLTNAAWREHLGYGDVPEITARLAGEHLARLAEHQDLTVFEYFATDIAGHRGSMDGARAVLQALDEFLAGTLARWSADDVLIVASDHGNVEDLSTPHHTSNPALGVWTGPPPDRDLRSLLDVAPAILASLGVAPEPTLPAIGADS